MNLEEYLYKKRMTTAEFARTIGYTPPAITMYLKGAAACSDKLARAIEFGTKKKVSFEDSKAYSLEAQKKRKATVTLRQQKNTGLIEEIKRRCCKKCKKEIELLEKEQ